VSTAATDALSRAAALVSLFCTPVDAFARFRAVAPDLVPEPCRGLLDHTSHMTVVMERFHGQLLHLRVVARRDEPGDLHAWYAREILLVTATGTPVQHGIVRIDLRQVGADTAARIRAAAEPLGRVLIEAGLLREVRRVQLLRVQPGPRLLAVTGMDGDRGAVTYGRVADIALAGKAEPAVELLEIVVPGEPATHAPV
jgi:hypothetical protein